MPHGEYLFVRSDSVKQYSAPSASPPFLFLFYTYRNSFSMHNTQRSGARQHRVILTARQPSSVCVLLNRIKKLKRVSVHKKQAMEKPQPVFAVLYASPQIARWVSAFFSHYAGLLAHGSSPLFSFSGFRMDAQWMAYALKSCSSFTVAGPRRTSTCFPLSCHR